MCSEADDNVFFSCQVMMMDQLPIVSLAWESHASLADLILFTAQYVWSASLSRLLADAV